MNTTTRLQESLAPLQDGDVGNWRGLPHASVPEFDALFGAPEVVCEEPLGARPAQRRRYRDAQGRVLDLWSRQDRAVMVQPAALPATEVLATLPAPDHILPHEMLVPGHYAHEYLYCGIGLVLTVAQPLPDGPPHIARCRGIAPLSSPKDFGADYYLAFEDRTVWSALDVP